MRRCQGLNRRPMLRFGLIVSPARKAKTQFWLAAMASAQRNEAELRISS